MGLLKTHLVRRLPALQALWSEPTLSQLNQLAQASACPVSFCENHPESAQDYERFVFENAQVPTRIETWHDRLNIAMWLLWPETKLALNRAHIHDLSRSVSTGTRSRRRDALTLIDECALVLVSPDPSWSELNRNHRWKEMFWHRRNAWLNGVTPLVLGHGLAEQLLKPHLGLTAKAIHFQTERHATSSEVQQVADRWLASRIEVDFVDPKPLCPLPVLGIPNWHETQSIEFYENESYFRPLPRR